RGLHLRHVHGARPARPRGRSSRVRGPPRGTGGGGAVAGAGRRAPREPRRRSQRGEVRVRADRAHGLRPARALAAGGRPREEAVSGAMARAGELRGEGGLRRLGVGALAVTVYRRLLILERSTEPAETANPLGLEVRILEDGDLDGYETLRPGTRATAEAR